MKKNIDFSTYKKVMKLSYNDFNRWITAFYKSAYLDGMEDNSYTSDSLMNTLLSIRGIGEKRALEIVSKLVGDNHGIKT